MYAVIEVVGKQHRVAQGDEILVECPVDREPVGRVLMLVDGDKVLSGADAASATVALSHAGTYRIRGERSMKFRPKQGRTSKRMLGYRRTLSRVTVDSIGS